MRLAVQGGRPMEKISKSVGRESSHDPSILLFSFPFFFFSLFLLQSRGGLMMS
jgi:hypothetical protein